MYCAIHRGCVSSCGHRPAGVNDSKTREQSIGEGGKYSCTAVI